MKHLYCATLLLITGIITAGAQVASHAPSLPAAKPASSGATTHGAAPNAKNVSMTPAMQVTGRPVAKVNGAVLTDRDLLREMYAIFPYAAQHNGFPKELEPEIRRGALEMIIFEELVYQDAKRHNMTIAPEKLAAAEKEYRQQFSSQEAYKQFLQTETNGSEAAMREKIRRAMLLGFWQRSSLTTTTT